MSKAKSKQPLVSIIVPIYNVEKYLDRCVQSILNQTYKNLEIILVNDGSPDGCGVMCNNYAKYDKRVKVIHKKNGGLSDARNAAIDAAKGDYLLCIDSDDYVHHSLVAALYDSLDKNNADVAVAGYLDVFDDDQPDLSTTVSGAIQVFDTQSALETMMYQKDMTASAWGKLYSAKLFRGGVRYPKGKLCEDLATTYKLIAESKYVVCNSTKLYYYLQRQDSIINSKFKPERMDAIQFAKEQLAFIQERFPDITKAARNRLFMEGAFTLLAISQNNLSKHEKDSLECTKVIRQYAGSVLRDKKSRLLYRLYAAISLVSPRLIVGLDVVKRVVKNKIIRRII